MNAQPNPDQNFTDRTRKSPYRLLCDYRTPIMGLATLWVMYNHAMLMGLTAGHEPFRFLQLSAHISVDIFFLLSGFGIYHSLSKNTIKDYFIKRLARLLPVWGSFLLIHIIVDGSVFHLTFSLKEIIGFLSFQGFAARLGNQGNWYVYTIFLYYLIAPIPYSFFRESKHRLTTCCILTAVVWVASYSYFGNRDLLITFIRIPAFLIGMYMASAGSTSAKASETKQEPSLAGASKPAVRSLRGLSDRIDASVSRPLTAAGLYICIGITLLFGLLHFFILKKCSVDVLWDYGLWWHALIPAALPLSLLLANCFSRIKSPKNILLACLSAVGSASLEIFLLHLYIFKYWGEITGILQQKSVPFRIGIFFLSICLGLVWHMLIGLLSRLIGSLRHLR